MRVAHLTVTVAAGLAFTVIAGMFAARHLLIVIPVAIAAGLLGWWVAAGIRRDADRAALDEAFAAHRETAAETKEIIR